MKHIKKFTEAVKTKCQTPDAQFKIDIKDDGILVTLCSPYWVTNNDPHQIEFRTWLSDKKYYMSMLPDNSFIEHHKSVPTALLVINK